MSISAINDFARYDRSSSRKVIPQNIIGGAALACIVLACGWTIWTNVFEAASEPAASVIAPVKSSQRVAATPAAVQSSEFSARFGGTDAMVHAAKVPTPAAKRLAVAESTIVESPGFSARFDAVRIAAPPRRAAVAAAPSAIRKTYAALLDPAYSLGPAPGTFAATAPGRNDRRLALATPAQDDVKLPPEVPPPPATVAELEAIPLPIRRPSSLRLLADREMAKAKAAVLAVTEPEKPTIFERLFGKGPSAGPRFAYASADLGDITTGGLGRVNASGAAALYDRSTAVYDISAHMVYLPDGTKLEAHSGLGNRLDDPDSVREKMRGATPPHLYDLSLRESLFHGVQAIRLTPVDGEEAIYGRTGLLAHTFMLGPNGDSNGCVSFRNYDAFLHAYNQGIKRLAVVAKLD